ncbi:hypothetical protein FC831_15205 [Clostridium botulinum]|nr:hypothetical protein [Clostridium botulinum]
MNVMNVFNQKGFQELKATITFDEVYKNLNNLIIPYKYNKELLSYYEYRRKIISQQGFTILTQEWINEFAKWIDNRKCLEIMSGCGSLSKVLKDRDVDIIATDNFTWSSDTYNWNHNKNYWTDIENIDCIEAIEKYKDRDVIIMSWAYMDDTAYRCLLKMREVNPDMVMIVIGEDWGGCTANDDFFEAIEDISNEEIQKIDSKIPRWVGTNDHMMLVK